MLAHATPVALPEEVRSAAVDVVGTGGDGARTVNISTMAALVVAGAGVPVAKHGNRAASSACGAADLLEHLGVPLDLGPEEVARCVTEAGIGFCFARPFHPGMRHAGRCRRRDGRADRVQHPRPADQPGPPGGRRDRLRRPADGAGDGAGVRRPGAVGAGDAGRGRPGRVHHRRAYPGMDRCRWEVRETVVDAAELGMPAPPRGAPRW